MSTTAFPVRQTSEGVGCTDIALRKIFGALYPDKGIITGLTVKGGNTLSYTVAEGVAVCSKGDADGSTLAYYEGGSVDVSANSSSNPRIDVVWITSHDVTQGDTDNLVAIGVTEGKAAATPVEPDVPSYATKLCAMQLPAGSSTTSSATQYGNAGQAIPYGASLGLMAEIVGTKNGNWEGGNVGSTTFTLPTARTIQFNVTVTAGAVNGVMADGDGSVYSKMWLDGNTLEQREVRIRAMGNAVSSCYQYTTEIAAGEHTLSWTYAKNACDALYLYYAKGGWAGQQIQIVDLGPVD